jgi:hypothetical protein
MRTQLLQQLKLNKTTKGSTHRFGGNKITTSRNLKTSYQIVIAKFTVKENMNRDI